jgi:hypothetical protein
MKRTLFLVAAALPALLAAQDLGDLESRADEVATVTVNSDVLRAFARLCADEKDKDFLQALKNVSEISVRALSFHNGRMPADSDVDRVRAATIPPGWPKFLTSRSSHPAELVEGYMGPGGMALLSIEPGEIATVRIVGSLSPSSVPALGAHFGLPHIRQGIVIQAPPGAPSAFAPPPAGPRPGKLDFNRLVRDVEAREGIRKLHIPLFGLIRPVAFIGSGGSVRGLEMAIFENAPSGFVAGVAPSVPHGWSPFVEAREKDDITRIWLGETGASMHLLIATQDSEDAVLLTTKVRIADLDKDPFDWRRDSRSRDN